MKHYMVNCESLLVHAGRYSSRTNESKDACNDWPSLGLYMIERALNCESHLVTSRRVEDPVGEGLR